MLHETIPSLQIPRFWNHDFDGSSVRCAVLDTGIDAGHPDFAGRIKEQRNFSLEGNEDLIGHGTHVAGIVAGAGKIFRGVAPEVELVIAKVLGADGGDDTDVIAGLSWASRQNVDVINMSLGGPAGPDSALTRECDALSKEGFLICAAAGNSGPARSTISSPGNASGVITVGAVDKTRRLAAYSSRGPVEGKRYTKPDVVCFGGGVDFQAACLYRTGITSTKSSSMTSTNCDQKRFYTRMSGTSMATPHITGITVLLLDILNKFAPEWNRKKKAGFIKTLLRENTVPLEDSSLTRWDIGYGFLEPVQALEKTLEFLAKGKRKRLHV
jgi:subtilisin family serine protease